MAGAVHAGCFFTEEAIFKAFAAEFFHFFCGAEKTIIAAVNARELGALRAQNALFAVECFANFAEFNAVFAVIAGADFA